MMSGGRAFAAKPTAADSIEYATYLYLFGGNIAVDRKGQAWVAGTTCPASAGPVGSNCDTLPLLSLLVIAAEPGIFRGANGAVAALNEDVVAGGVYSDRNSDAPIVYTMP